MPQDREATFKHAISGMDDEAIALDMSKCILSIRDQMDGYCDVDGNKLFDTDEGKGI